MSLVHVVLPRKAMHLVSGHYNLIRKLEGKSLQRNTQHRRSYHAFIIPGVSCCQDLLTPRPTTSVCRLTHIHLLGIPLLLPGEDDQAYAKYKTNQTFSRLTPASIFTQLRT